MPELKTASRTPARFALRAPARTIFFVGFVKIVLSLGFRFLVNFSRFLTILELKLSDREITNRKKTKKNNIEMKRRGYDKIFHESVLQADKGADFDFLRPIK